MRSTDAESRRGRIAIVTLTGRRTVRDHVPGLSMRSRSVQHTAGGYGSAHQRPARPHDHSRTYESSDRRKRDPDGPMPPPYSSQFACTHFTTYGRPRSLAGRAGSRSEARRRSAAAARPAVGDLADARQPALSRSSKETVLDVIAEESPETARRIVARLKERRALRPSASLPTLSGGSDGVVA